MRQQRDTYQTTSVDHRIAWLAALAIAIHIFEASFPSPLPGVKPGLANIITLLVMMLFGWRMAAWVSLLRVIVGSLLLGTFLSPTFILSLSGALAALLMLGVTKLLLGRVLGLIGFAVLAALAHMLAQFFVAYTLFMPHPALLHLLPILLSAALIFGIFSGIIAIRIAKHIKAYGSTNDIITR